MIEKTYEGSCHCGALGWTFRTTIEPADWNVRACQCSFCRTHRTRCTSDPAGSVDFRVSDAESLTHYRFGLETADFLVCGVCGVYIGAMMESAEGAFATLNLNTLATPVDAALEPVPVCYDSQGREERVAGRITRWTPVARSA